MRRLIGLFLCASLIAICLAGCDSDSTEFDEYNSSIKVEQVERENESGEKYTGRKITALPNIEGKKINEIGDSFFIEATNDVIVNLSEYVGKAISIQGFISRDKAKNGDMSYSVYRQTPGCCGNDGIAGLDIVCKDDYPQVGTWVKATGIVEKDPFNEKNPVIFVAKVEECEITVPFVTQ